MKKRQLLGVVRGRKVFRGDATDAGVAFHGGVVRLQVPYTEITETKAAHSVERVLQAIESGLAQIEGQTNPYLMVGLDATVETVDVFDVSTGDYVVIWRVACRDAQAPN